MLMYKTCNINDTKSIEISLENFVNTIKLYRHHYPDIIEPLLRNVTELLYGIKLKISALKKTARSNEFIIDLIRFPILNSKRTTIKCIVDGYLSKELQDHVKNLLTSDEENVYQINKYNYRRVKLN